MSSDHIKESKIQNLRVPSKKTSSSNLIFKEKQLNREKDCPQQGVPARIKITVWIMVRSWSRIKTMLLSANKTVDRR